jgi:hypothetical protein
VTTSPGGPSPAPVDDDDPIPPATPAELDAHEAFISGWLEQQFDENPVMVAVDRGEPGERRWYVRLAGEEKDYITVWLTLGQRSLHHEAYMLPAPEENHGAVFENLLHRNRQMRHMRFAIGHEDAIYLIGELPLSALSGPQLDRIIGSTWVYVERFFRPTLHLAFASRFRS